MLRFSHYNFAPAEGGRASFGVRPSLKNEEKNMFFYMRGLFATFFSMCFFSQLFTMGSGVSRISFRGGFKIYLEGVGICMARSAMQRVAKPRVC